MVRRPAKEPLADTTQAFLRLLLMSLSMLIGTIVVGHIPLAFNLSERRVRHLSDFGTGLLVGAALSIIIPEGVDAVYSSSQPADHDHDGLHRRDEHHGHGSQVTAIALALLCGFITMFLIDSLSEAHPEMSVNIAHTHAHGPTPTRRRSTNGNRPAAQPLLDSNRARTPTPDDYTAQLTPRSSGAAKETNSDGPSSKKDRAHTSSTSLGLICHSIADGVSLGASSAAGAAAGAGGVDTLSLTVFTAIMIHKAPAALGLTSVLLRDGASRAHIRRALGLFAASAPLGALSTYAVINMLGSQIEQGEDAAMTLRWWTGELLTVSGGTFLFVATHVMKAAEPDAEGERNERVKRTALMLGGMIAPIALQQVFGHAH